MFHPRSAGWMLAASLMAAGMPAFAQDAAPTAPAGNTAPSAPVPPATDAPAGSPAAAPEAAAPSSETQPSAQTPPAQSADSAEKNAKVLSAIAALAPMIGDVQIVGPWVDGDRQGVWRTIMTQSVGETAGNRFFVQQLQEKDGESTVLSSTEVTEIADLDGAIVGYRADAPAEGEESNLTLFFDIVPLDGEVSETYELFFSPNQPYRFGPASN